MPVPSGQRNAGQQRGHGGHHDGAEAQQAGFVDGIRGVLAVLAFGLQSEVHHHDAVLLHDADEQDDADDGHHTEILAEEDQREQRAHAGGRQRGENRDRVDEALVQDAQHDVDRDQRGQDEQRFVGQRILEEAAVPWKPACRLAGMFISFCTLSMAEIALPSEASGARLNETVTEGN